MFNDFVVFVFAIFLILAIASLIPFFKTLHPLFTSEKRLFFVNKIENQGGYVWQTRTIASVSSAEVRPDCVVLSPFSAVLLAEDG